jgi:hypothetical protein
MEPFNLAKKTNESEIVWKTTIKTKITWKRDEVDKKSDEKKTDKEKEAEEVVFTADEKTYIEDEAYNRLEKMLAEIFIKIQSKAAYMVKLNIPPRFRREDPTKTKEGQLMLLRKPSSLQGVPKAKLDWEARLKSWK